MKFTIKDVLRIILALSCVTATQIKSAGVPREFEDVVSMMPANMRHPLDTAFNTWMDNVIKERVSNITDEEIKFIRSEKGMGARLFKFRETYINMITSRPELQNQYNWINLSAEEIEKNLRENYLQALEEREQWAQNYLQRLEGIERRKQEIRMREQSNNEQADLIVIAGGLAVACIGYLYLHLTK